MQQEITLPLAFLAGMLSIFSPCILPLIPSYFGIIAGSNPKKIAKENKGAVLRPALAFITGFSLIFILLGISASWIGRFLLQRQFELARYGGIIIILLGLHTLGIFNLPFSNLNLQNKLPSGLKGSVKAFVFGLVIALAWTPCIGPVLGTILVVAGSSANLFTGTFLMIAYSLGLSVPFLLAAVFMERWMKSSRHLSKHLPTLKVISGILIIIVGILVFTGQFAALANL